MSAKLFVQNVKGLKDGRYDFKEINYIVGSNRSGKSAILQAIQYAVFGKCDEIGSRGAGALIRKGEKSCSITYCVSEQQEDEYVFAAEVSVNSKGSVSQSRSAKVHGIEVKQSHIDSLVGVVPVTIQQFMELTGEQMWQLVMPQNSIEVLIPNRITDGMVELVNKLSAAKEPADEISRAVGSDAELTVKLDAMLSAVQASQRATREKARAIMSLLEEPVVLDASWPPLGDLLIEETALNNRIRAATKAMADRKKNQAAIDYAKQQLEQNKSKLASMQNELKETETRLQLIQEVHKAVEDFDMPDYLDSERVPTSLFSPEVAKLVESIESLSANHPICQAAKNFSGLVSEYITNKTYAPGRDLEFDQRFAALQDKLSSLRSQLTIRPSIQGKNQAVTELGRSINTCLLAIRSLKDRIEPIQAKIDQLTKESESCHVSLESIDQDQFEADTKRLTEVTSVVKCIRQAQAQIAQAQDARNRVKDLERFDPLYDQLIKDLQDFRKGIIDDNLKLIGERANKVIGYCDLAPIELEAVAGKRPSLLVRNQAGSQFAAMSGAERLIYGSALISAIQSARNVAMPLLFLEGGELDGAFTAKFLMGIAKYSPATTYIAHWHESPVISERLKVIHVA